MMHGITSVEKRLNKKNWKLEKFQTYFNSPFGTLIFIIFPSHVHDVLILYNTLMQHISLLRCLDCDLQRLRCNCRIRSISCQAVVRVIGGGDTITSGGVTGVSFVGVCGVGEVILAIPMPDSSSSEVLLPSDFRRMAIAAVRFENLLVGANIADHNIPTGLNTNTNAFLVGL